MRKNTEKGKQNLLVCPLVMNLYSAFSIGILKCALQESDLWVRSDISIYIYKVFPCDTVTRIEKFPENSSYIIRTKDNSDYTNTRH